METELYRLYEECKREWKKEHPDATPEEYEKFIKSLAKVLGI